MSLYIRLQTNFWTNRKTIRLSIDIGESAYWILPRLWCYAAENQPDGNFSNYADEELASLLGYKENAQALLQALHKHKFMDNRILHDWDEHNEYHSIYAKRATKAASARWEKDKIRKEMKGKEQALHKHCISNATSIDSKSLNKKHLRHLSPPAYEFIRLWNIKYKEVLLKDYLSEGIKEEIFSEKIVSLDGYKPEELIDLAVKAWKNSAGFWSKHAITISGFVNKFNNIRGELGDLKPKLQITKNWP